MARSKMDKLKEAGAGMDKFFSEASESPQKAQEGKKPRVVDTHKVFSFRALIETVDSWRVWAEAKGIKVDELGTLAITEYIKKHPLTEDQKKIYELKMAQKKS